MKRPQIIKKLQHHPATLGLIISAMLIVGLLVHVSILDRFPVILEDAKMLQDFQTAVVNTLLVGYLVGAYYAVLGSTMKTLGELEKTWDAETEAIRTGYAAKNSQRKLYIIGLVGVLLAAILNYLTVGSGWKGSLSEPEMMWNQTLGLFVGWWFAWFAIAVSDSVTYISAITARIGEVDLLDQSPWFPPRKGASIHRPLFVLRKQHCLRFF